MDTYEKRYKDALERARDVYTYYCDDREQLRKIESIFPELKESEDERIRKQLLNWFKDCHWDAIDEDKTPLKRDDILAWLEKQGEQKPVLDNALKEAFDKSKKDYPIEDKKEAIEYSDSILPTSVVYGESEDEYMLHTIMEAAFIAGQKKSYSNKNPAWSQEDK